MTGHASAAGQQREQGRPPRRRRASTQPAEGGQRRQADGGGREQRRQDVAHLIGRHQRHDAEQHQEEHRQLNERRRPLHQPREPGVHALQHAPRRATADAERDLVDDIRRERAQVEEELIERRQRAPAAGAEPREIRPVELEDVDGAIVRPAAERDARGLVQRLAFREVETPEEVVVQRDAEIACGPHRICVDGTGLLHLVKAAWRSGPLARTLGLITSRGG